jgi:hypothetical protein
MEEAALILFSWLVVNAYVDVANRKRGVETVGSKDLIVDK